MTPWKKHLKFQLNDKVKIVHGPRCYKHKKGIVTNVGYVKKYPYIVLLPSINKSEGDESVALKTSELKLIGRQKKIKFKYNEKQ